MLNLNFQNGTTPALNARNMNAIVESINTLDTQLASPFNYKGVVADVASLPATGNTVNDTYYVTAETCLYSWNGSAWSQSSLEESDYLEEITDLKSALNYNHNAEAGYVLRATDTGHGSEWAMIGTPTDAQATEAINNWLDAHPEATTTVQDGAITEVKLDSQLKQKINDITHTVIENGGLTETINTASAYTTYIGKEYIINQPILLTDRDFIFNKIISNAKIVLNSTMFTWSARWMPIPDFVNCVFVGNGNYIVAEGKYCTKSKFINCIFYNCGIINNGDELQSARFIGCRFIGTTNLIQAKILNDFEMDSCQFESDFQACIVDTSIYDKGGFTSVQSFRVLNTIMEGQSAQTSVLFKISQGGQIFFDKCYFEQVMCGLLDLVAPQNAPTNPMMLLAVTNCKFSMGRRPFININSYYENGNRVYVDISNNQLTETEDNPFISTDTFKHITIQNNIIGSSYITLENQKSVSDLANETNELANRTNVKVIDAWVDGTLNADTDTTIASYSAQLGQFFDKFAYADRLKYTNTISMAIVEKGKDSNGNDPVNGVYLRPRLYGNTGYANYLEVLQTSNNAIVTTGKYRIRIAYTG